MPHSILNDCGRGYSLNDSFITPFLIKAVFFFLVLENICDRCRRTCLDLRYNRFVFLFIVWFFISTISTLSQDSAVEKEQLLEIDRIEFIGHEAFDADALRGVLMLKETPGGFSKFFYKTFGEKLGSKPEYFDKILLEEDQKRLIEFYERHGFYQRVINSAFSIDTGDQRVNILFTIREGIRSLVDSVRYVGLDGVPVLVVEKILKEPILYKGIQYESGKSSLEIQRILAILVNNGYPSAKFDAEHSTAERFVSTNNFVLTYVFTPGDVRTFGDVAVRVEPSRDDITDHLAIRHLDFQKGDLYSREKIISSEGNLNRLGLFETATIDSLSNHDSNQVSTIPMVITARPRPRNELSPELIISDENNAFNLGAGLGYTNNNFFGDARIFNARIRAQTQSIRELIQGGGFRDTAVVGTVNLEFQILQPYLFTRTLSGSWTSSISAEKQIFYILSILRNKMGLSNRFATYTYGFLDWTLERVNTEFLLDTFQLQNVTRTLPERQFNSIITFTLQRDKTNDIFSPTEGFFNSISLEESGLLPKLFPGVVSGLPFTQYYKVTLFERWYQDLTPTRFNILALKLKGGYQAKYGESRSLPISIPLNRRFFAGGSGSIRGWKARGLGDMPNEQLQFGGNFIFEGSVEMRVNHFRGFGKLGFIRLENLWAVYFLDFGNVWTDISDFMPRDIAISAGIGFRYETFFGPFRIDYGFRVYDPKDRAGHQSIFQKQFFGETLRNAIFHIGIGHAF